MVGDEVCQTNIAAGKCPLGESGLHGDGDAVNAHAQSCRPDGYFDREIVRNESLYLMVDGRRSEDS